MADDLQQPDIDEPGITAYHGSPHDFEQFDISKIGTGEGNQSYGHGLYFAQNEDVAKGYRDTLGGHHPGDVLIGDEKYPHWASRDIINAYRKLGYDNETAVMASHFLKEHKGDLNAAAAATWSNDKIPDSVAEAIFKTEYATPAGHMYEVNINAHPDHFLDWDKPFHEQSEHVKRGLRSIPEFDDRVAKYGVLDPDYKSKISMGEFINRGVLPHSYDKSGPEFSNAYHAAGIKGVKYLDQGSRWGDKKNLTSNYVVFDDKLVNVKRKYAKGGTVRPSTTVEHTGNGIFDVFHGDKKAGTISLARNGEGNFVSAANLDEPFIGKGIGHEAYNLIEQKIGRKIAPSPLGISPTASKFWIKRLKSFSPEERQQLYQTTRQAGSSYGIPERDVNLRLYGIGGSESLPPIEENSNIPKGKGGSIVQRALMLTSKKA
jgi:hypothetical protein